MTYESARMSTSPQRCKLKLIKKACKPGDVGLQTSQGITKPQFCHVQELFPEMHDHNASQCDQAWKDLKKHHDAVSSKHVDESESIPPQGVLEFSCLVEIFS